MIDTKHENALKVKEWFESKGVEYTVDDSVLVQVYKDISYYGAIVNSLSYSERVRVMRMQISYIRKNILGLLYEKNQSAKGIKYGYVYAIHNPAWKDYVKIGVAIDVYDRLNSYQTSSPLRDYELIGCVFSDDRLSLEKEIHDKFERNNEWVKTNKSTIKKFLKDHEYFPMDKISSFCLRETIKCIGSCSQVTSKDVEKDKIRTFLSLVKNAVSVVDTSFSQVDVKSKDSIKRINCKWIHEGLGFTMKTEDRCVVVLDL